VLSRAWFYWGTVKAREPSIFWEEALATGLVRVTGDAPCPDENPHPEGSGIADRARVLAPSPLPDPAAIARIEPELAHLELVESTRPRAARWRCPSVISVTALLTFLRDEEEFYWRYVRRVPAPPSPAAQLGIELHRRIEEHARGGVVLATPAEEEEPYDLDAGERRGDGRGVSAEQMWQNFLASRFSKMTPLMTEQPFTLYLGEGLSVAGRIDAIFECPDGSWEIVDYKTGTSDPDPLQLKFYSRAVQEVWGRETRCSWLLLRDGREVTAPRDTAFLDLAAAIRQLAAVGG
jgi:DNA helicase-2/ATP-dependent DNA helicase PcrA